MHGTSGVESCNSRAWSHSFIAFKVLERSYIGDIYEKGLEEEWILKDPKTGQPTMSDNDWSLDSKTKISATTNQYMFKNPDYYVHLAAMGVEWIGKHYVLSNSKKSRVYTSCTMLDPQIVVYRKKLV